MNELFTVLAKLAQVWGIPIVLVIFYIWRDWDREKTLSTRVTRLELEMRIILEAAIIKEEKRTIQFCKVVEESTKTQERLCQLLDARPCLQGKVT